MGLTDITNKKKRHGRVKKASPVFRKVAAPCALQAVPASTSPATAGTYTHATATPVKTANLVNIDIFDDESEISPPALESRGTSAESASPRKRSPRKRTPRKRTPKRSPKKRALAAEASAHPKEAAEAVAKPNAGRVAERSTENVLQTIFQLILALLTLFCSPQRRQRAAVKARELEAVKNQRRDAERADGTLARPTVPRRPSQSEKIVAAAKARQLAREHQIPPAPKRRRASLLGSAERSVRAAWRVAAPALFNVPNLKKRRA